MIIFDYFPELFEELKKVYNIVKDKCEIKYKKDIINEIINLRQQYLSKKTSIDIHKIYDLLIVFVENYIKSYNFDDVFDNIDFRNFVSCYLGIFKILNIDDNYFIKFTNKIAHLKKDIQTDDDDSSEDEEGEINIENLKNDLEKRNQISNSLRNIKITKSNYNYESGMNLIYLLDFLNEYICNFINKDDNKAIVYKNIKNKGLFKIVEKPNIEKLKDYDKDKIIILSLCSRDLSIEDSHASNICKNNNLQYYHNSCNYKTNVSAVDFNKLNIQKILDESKNIGNYNFKNPEIDYYVELIN